MTAAANPSDTLITPAIEPAIAPIPVVSVSAPINCSGESILDWSIWLSLQIAHRVAIVAFLALVGVWFLMFKVAGYEKVLAGCFVAADLAIFFAGLAVVLSRARPVSRSEGRGLLIFNGILLSIVIYTMLFSRLTYFRIRLQPLTNAPPQTELPK